MPWMRVAIGVGAAGLLAGIVGMVAWLDDGSHYFAVAVAVASAGFLTLVACVLAQIFGSAHGSQDDAFRRGKSMGYDEGFLEGRRTARPVVVPMPLAFRDTATLTSDVKPEPEVADGDVETVDPEKPRPVIIPNWGRDTTPLTVLGASARLGSWVLARRIPIVGGALCLGLVGVLVAHAFASVPAPGAQASQRSSGSLSSPVEPSPGGSGGWSTTSGDPSIPLVGVAKTSTLAPPQAGAIAAVPVFGTNGVAVPVPVPVAASAGQTGAASMIPSAVNLPASGTWTGYTSSVTSAAASPAVAVAAPAAAVVPPAPAPAAPAPPAPVSAPPAVLTAAQQTAATAATAAAQTAATAAAAAAQTAATATEAARVTAANAAAAAAATAAQAKTDACAVKGLVC